MVSLRAGLCLAVLTSIVSVPLGQGTGRSPLWGHAGELWDAKGRLPDYSYAGYKGGSEALPYVPQVANVRNFGARGNGTTNDAQAFRDAIAYAASKGGGAVYVPRGTYVIGSIVEIDVDRVVLRGEASGPNGSVLYFNKPGKTLTGSSTPWIHGQGGLIHFGDKDELAPGKGSTLTSVTSDQKRGDRTLRVSSPGKVTPGEYVILEQRDDAAGSLGWHIHNDQAAGGTCRYQPNPTRWIVQVKDVVGSTVTLAQPLRLDVRSEWSPKLIAYKPVQEVGLESLHLEGKAHSYPGHLLEDGYNPVTFDGVLNGWMDDVTMKYVDNGPSLVGLTKHCTLQNITLLDSIDAHHGFTITFAHDCLLQDFVIEPVMRHAVTLDHQASGNVIRRGGGSDLYFDHHRDGPFENLFTDLHAGGGAAPWSSGGSMCAGPRAGARNTYWNLRSNNWTAPPDLPTSPEWAQIQSNVLPARTQRTTSKNEWYEKHASLDTPDLYTAQLVRRLESDVLVRTRHTAVPFEDGTTGVLGQEEGPDPRFDEGAVWATGLTRHRWVDPTTLFDDQDVMLVVAAGLPRSARVGVLLRASTTQGSTSSGTHVYVERLDTPLGSQSYVRLHVAVSGGVVASSQPLPVDPDRFDQKVHLELRGNRLQAAVQNRGAIDFSGIPLGPEGGGFTSITLEPADDFEGLGVRHLQVMAPGQGADLHIDGDATLWLSFFERDMGPSPDPNRFSFTYNGTSMSYAQFVNYVLPSASKIESRSKHHLTIGFPTGALVQGDFMRMSHGVTDEVFVPWWR